MDFPWIVDFLQQSCRRASRASRQDSQEPQQPIAANITNEAQGLPAISSRLSPAMECSTTPAAESPGPSSTVVGPPAPPLLPMSPSMILAMEFPENEAWLESTEKAAQEAKGASGSKTWRLFGSPSSSSSSAAAAESGRKSPENSFKDDAEPPQGNSNKDEDDATKKSLSALLGFDTAADQLARALGSVAGLGVSPSLLRAQEGFARKIVERDLSLQPHHYTEVKCKSFAVDAPLPGSSRRDSTSDIPQDAQGLIDVADALLYGGELPVDRDLPPPVPSIEVIDLAPDVFRSVRLAFGYRFKSFARSVGRQPLKPIGGGGGRSGADFFLTHDARFVVKGIPSAECVLLLKLLESYVDHVISNAKHTLLPRFLGLYKVKLPDAGSNKWQCLVVMPNLFKVHKSTGVELHCMYDLKGSTYMRETKEASTGDGASDEAGEKKGARKGLESEWKAKVTVKAAAAAAAEAAAAAAAAAPQADAPNSTEEEGLTSAVAGLSVSAAPVSLLPPPKISSSVLKDLNFCPHHKPSKKRSALSSRDSSSSASRSISRSSSSVSSSWTLSRSASGSESGGNNLFGGEDDLSGSSSGAVVEENEVNAAATDECTRLRLGADRRAVFLANVKNDTAWLEQHDIMDYSLLLGVGRCSNSKTVTEKLERKGRRDAMRAAQKSAAAGGAAPATAEGPASLTTTEGNRNHLDSSNTSSRSGAVSLRGEEEQFRFGAGDAAEQEEEEFEYLLSRGASALSAAETARVQLLMQRSRASKGTPPVETSTNSPLRSPNVQPSDSNPSGAAATSGIGEDSSSDEESDEKRLVGGATRRLQDPVSYWENELGGVCACHPTTNLRMTTTSNYGVFTSGRASTSSSSSSSGGWQRTLSESKASKLLGITESGSYFDESRPALCALPEDLLPTELEHTDECNEGDPGIIEDEMPTGASEGIERSEDIWNESDDADEREWYTFGIIDILQRYDTRKKSEGVLKETIMRNEGVSSVPPKRYAERFIGFLEKHTM